MFYGGTKTSSTPGTAVQVETTNKPAQWVQIQARAGNAGNIILGGSDAVVATQNGIILAPGESVPIMSATGVNSVNLNSLWFDVANSGDGITWLRKVG